MKENEVKISFDETILSLLNSGDVARPENAVLNIAQMYTYLESVTQTETGMKENNNDSAPTCNSNNIEF